MMIPTAIKYKMNQSPPSLLLRSLHRQNPNTKPAANFELPIVFLKEIALNQAACGTKVPLH